MGCNEGTSVLLLPRACLELVLSPAFVNTKYDISYACLSVTTITILIYRDFQYYTDFVLKSFSNFCRESIHSVPLFRQDSSPLAYAGEPAHNSCVEREKEGKQEQRGRRSEG